MAAALVNKLFDTETRLRSNVRGRGKGKLDPKKIEYVKKKCFEMFPSNRDGDMKKDWDDCIVSIDKRTKMYTKETTRQRIILSTLMYVYMYCHVHDVIIAHISCGMLLQFT